MTAFETQLPALARGVCTLVDRELAHCTPSRSYRSPSTVEVVVVDRPLVVLRRAEEAARQTRALDERDEVGERAHLVDLALQREDGASELANFGLRATHA